MKIPFVDLGAQYRAHKSEFDHALGLVIDRNAFIGGDFVREFERRFAEAYGVRHCISCGNGTDAIYIALKMLGIGPGDEVITTAASWISTSETISQTGATPVFVDVDDHYLINSSLVEAAITPRTRAVVPVHLYGQAAAMDDLIRLCRQHSLKLIEDCAQAHFAEWRGRRVGTSGDAGTFSFYPGKNLGAWGDAGAIVTNDDDLARRCRMYANHGSLVKHQHEMEGVNSRLDGLQAALLTAKLNHIDEWTAQRRRVAAAYDRLLAGLGDLGLPSVRPGATHVYHLYVVRTGHRDELRRFLAEKGIETGIHYPTALPLLPAYARLGIGPERIPRAASNQGRILSLPIFPELTDAMVDYVGSMVGEFFAARHGGIRTKAH
ncbi:MAG: DegT/DnrJ/EryC1/StrS family aminotransferase [Gammaproteobacteria bacterium]|nr:MAG: DegT/DnrJ/EryC1/StrS family aminotransferase [Gammaproteobacteria bacterium]